MTAKPAQQRPQKKSNGTLDIPTNLCYYSIIMKKQTISVPRSTAPRNPVAVAAHFRRSGAHGKTNKAQRRADKVSVTKGSWNFA
jgi:hypothetical protein